MALSTTEAPPRPAPPAAARRLLRPELIVVGVVAVAALGLAVASHATHPTGLGTVLRGALPAVVLFLASGDALAQTLVPKDWGPLRALLALPIGAASSGLALTALGVAHVPLSVSVWVVLAAGVASAVAVRRRGAGATSGGEGRRLALGAWLVVLAIVFCIGLIPAWRTGQVTVYGENPDAHQVVGIAALFQHVPPTGTDNALPIDTVPPAWRFRYPIFYGLAAVSSAADLDPIRTFPAIAALLVMMIALGFGAIATRCLSTPPAAGMAVAAALAFWSIPLHLAWHPYWNQLWGLAMLPYALLFGWHALSARDGRSAVLLALMLVMLWLAYPLALPYPVLVLGALTAAYWRGRPRVPERLRSRAWLGGVIGVIVLLPAVLGAAVKLVQGVSQLLSPSSSLWSGDIQQLLPIGQFAGTGGGVLPALALLAVAFVGLRALPRRPQIALGGALAVLCLLDLRFRLVGGPGAYMDFKHLTFVGALVLMLAAVAVCRLLASRTIVGVLIGLALTGAWTVPALVQARHEALTEELQVTSEMFQIRDWAKRLPPGASVRVDIPPSGVQLWAVYMLASHPVDAAAPVLFTTYAHAPYGYRADYSLSLAVEPSPDPSIRRSFPLPRFAEDPALGRNRQFVLRRIVWPARLDAYPDTSSLRLVEP